MSGRLLFAGRGALPPCGVHAIFVRLRRRGEIIESIDIGSARLKLVTSKLIAKLFQISVVPMPSFSKECFGGFVEFQWVAIDPNGKLYSPNFWPDGGLAQPARQRKIVAGARSHSSMRSVFPKHKSSSAPFPKSGGQTTRPASGSGGRAGPLPR